MLKNYFKIAFRNINKSKIYASINIFGLAAGITSCILIFLYVVNNLNFDKFHKNYKKIYRVCQQFKKNTDESPWSLTPPGFGRALENEFPGVKETKIFPAGMYTPIISYNNSLFTSSDFIFTDKSFFSVFDFKFLSGSPETALSEPSSIVITESIAKMIFGDEKSLGKTIRMDNKYDLKITGIIKDIPDNSSIQFKYAATINLLSQKWGIPSIEQFDNNFQAANFYTFVVIPESYNIKQLESKLPSLIDKYKGENASEFYKLFFQPLNEIHFASSLRFDFQNTANVYYDYLLAAIAFFILFIACLNFINISTALATTRLKEIGLRKVLGADRLRIVWQFITENIFLTLISIILSALFAELILPYFNNLVGKNLSLNPLTNQGVLVAFFIIWLLVVFITSSYPAIYMSSFQPVSILKGTMRTGKRGKVFKRSLIVFQFVIAVFLITLTIAISEQYNFMKNSELGFNKEQVLFVPYNEQISKNYDVFRNNLLQNPNIKLVSRANWVPGEPRDIEGYSWTGKTGQVSDGFYSLIVDPEYAATLKLNFIAGRNFSKDTPTDFTDAFIINETAAKKIGWTNEASIGQILNSPFFHNRKIIGVVKDFNFKSLHQKIEPVVISWGNPSQFSDVIIKTRSADVNETLDFIGKNWGTLSPNFPFNYHFLDQDFEKLYMSEAKLTTIITLFSILSILIVCLGLLGLISHTARERTKEIGIRKILGSSITSVIFLLIKEYAGLILISNIIAFPLAFYSISTWLQSFAYRIEISWWIYAVAGGIALLISLVTVSFQAIKAAVANPVESLRYE